MKQWLTLFRKEILENVRNRKWIWVPPVFILIAIMDPIMNYFLPEILEAAGGLPEGAVFEMPELTSTDAFMMSISQLNTLGVLMIALISMGAIAGERKSGVAELILAKPVSFVAYILSKWAALLALILTSYVLAMLFTWYYIGVLFEFISVEQIIVLTIFYGLWLVFIATVSIFFNSLYKSAGLVAFSTIATAIMISIVTELLGENLTYSPSNLSQHALEYLLTGSLPNALYGTAAITISLCALLIVASVIIFRRKEHAG